MTVSDDDKWPADGPRPNNGVKYNETRFAATAEDIEPVTLGATQDLLTPEEALENALAEPDEDDPAEDTGGGAQSSGGKFDGPGSATLVHE